MKRTYYPHYYSIEDILVTQERVPCTAEQELSKFIKIEKKSFHKIKFEIYLIENLGFLDPSSETNDLKIGQNVDLPLWYILQVQKERSRNQFK